MHVAETTKTRISRKSANIEYLKEQIQYFESVFNRLIEEAEYREKFVAIKDEKIIDVGDDAFSLVERVQRQNPGNVVLIRKVSKHLGTIECTSAEIGE